jgi:hypothetical protein
VLQFSSITSSLISNSEKTHLNDSAANASRSARARAPKEEDDDARAALFLQEEDPRCSFVAVVSKRRSCSSDNTEEEEEDDEEEAVVSLSPTAAAAADVSVNKADLRVSEPLRKMRLALWGDP